MSARISRLPTPAEVFVVHREKVLLVHRVPEPWGGLFGDLWHVSGGAERPGETLQATAVREVREETGLDVRPEWLCSWSHAYEGMLVTHEAFIAVVDTDVVTLDHEHDDFRWAEPDELKE